MFGSKYLLLELDRSESEFYHLPLFVPYLRKYKKRLKESGFEWNLCVKSMSQLVKELDVEEYKLYKLFAKKWDHYKNLSGKIKSRSWKESEKIIDKILSIDLLDPSAYLNLGYVMRKQRDFQKAEYAYKKGLELLKTNIPLLAGLARTYEESQKEDEAIYTWKRILDISSNNEEALEMLSKHKVFQKVSTQDPKTNKPSFKYIPDKKFEDLMKIEFKKNYNDIEALTELGLKLMKDSYTKLAIKVFERVYRLSKNKHLQGQA